MKKIGQIIALALTLFCFQFKVHAGDLSIYASTTSVIVGNSVVITVKGNNIAGKLSLTSSNGGILSGGASAFWIDNSTVTYTFKAVSAGSATVTVKPIDVADYNNGSSYTTSKSVTINVRTKPVIVLSGDNNLSNLGIESYSLTPEFNKDTLEYNVELEPDTSEINISATASHGGATIEGAGTREVTDGDNRLEIKVTAENGSSKIYVINAKVKEYNPIEVNINNEKYTVVRKKSLITPPENYTETTVTINEEEIPAYYSEITKYTLVSLKDANGNQNFYIYQNGEYHLYKELTFNQMKICLLDIPQIPDGYSKSTIVYNDENLEAYKRNPNSKYAILYGMNVATGEEHYYSYESSENTLQIYHTEEINLLNEKVEQYVYLIIGLLGLSFIFLIIMLILVFKKGNKPKKEKVKKEKISKEENEIKVEKVDVK